MRGLTHETLHTHAASHAQHVQPTEVHSTHATGVLPSKTLMRDDVRCICAFTGSAYFTSSLRNGFSLPDSFDFFWLKRRDGKRGRGPHRYTVTL